MKLTASGFLLFFLLANTSPATSQTVARPHLNINDMAVLENTKISYVNGLLSVSASGVELEKLLHKISEIIPIELVTETPLVEKIFIDFDRLPVESALKRLLKKRAYVCNYSGVNQPPDDMNEFALIRITVFNSSPNINKPTRDRLRNEKKPSSKISSRPLTAAQLANSMSKILSVPTPYSNGEGLGHLEKEVMKSIKRAFHESDRLNIPDISLSPEMEDTLRNLKSHLDIHPRSFQTHNND